MTSSDRPDDLRVTRPPSPVFNPSPTFNLGPIPFPNQPADELLEPGTPNLLRDPHGDGVIAPDLHQVEREVLEALRLQGAGDGLVVAV